eukprot:tig00000767_g3973.t1
MQAQQTHPLAFGPVLEHRGASGVPRVPFGPFFEYPYGFGAPPLLPMQPPPQPPTVPAVPACAYPQTMQAWAPIGPQQAPPPPAYAAAAAAGPPAELRVVGPARTGGGRPLGAASLEGRAAPSPRRAGPAWPRGPGRGPPPDRPAPRDTVDEDLRAIARSRARREAPLECDPFERLPDEIVLGILELVGPLAALYSARLRHVCRRFRALAARIRWSLFDCSSRAFGEAGLDRGPRKPVWKALARLVCCSRLSSLQSVKQVRIGIRAKDEAKWAAELLVLLRTRALGIETVEVDFGGRPPQGYWESADAKEDRHEKQPPAWGWSAARQLLEAAVAAGGVSVRVAHDEGQALDWRGAEEAVIGHLQLKEVLSRGPFSLALERLEVPCVPLDPAALADFRPALPRLRALALAFAASGGDLAGTFRQLAPFRSLEELTLRAPLRFDARGAPQPAACPSLAPLPSALRSLALHGVALGPACFAQLAAAPRLEALDVQPSTEAVRGRALRELAACGSLRSLRVDSTCLPEAALGYLAGDAAALCDRLPGLRDLRLKLYPDFGGGERLPGTALDRLAAGRARECLRSLRAAFEPTLEGLRALSKLTALRELQIRLDGEVGAGTGWEALAGLRRLEALEVRAGAAGPLRPLASVVAALRRRGALRDVQLTLDFAASAHGGEADAVLHFVRAAGPALGSLFAAVDCGGLGPRAAPLLRALTAAGVAGRGRLRRVELRDVYPDPSPEEQAEAEEALGALRRALPAATVGVELFRKRRRRGPAVGNPAKRARPRQLT